VEILLAGRRLRLTGEIANHTPWHALRLQLRRPAAVTERVRLAFEAPAFPDRRHGQNPRLRGNPGALGAFGIGAMEAEGIGEPWSGVPIFVSSPIAFGALPPVRAGRGALPFPIVAPRLAGLRENPLAITPALLSRF
jgi:hypothetical protein